MTGPSSPAGRYAGALAAGLAALGALGSGSYYAADGISGSPHGASSHFTTPAAFGSEQGSGSSCGKERWAVKTLTDADAGSINFVPVDSTITALGSVPAPAAVGELPRQPQEESVYRVEGSIVAFKLEADSDIHLAIADPAGDHPTMIAEFPASSCDSNALDKTEIDTARQDFIAAYGQPSGQFRKPTGCAILTGVFFFDRIHGQFGVAPNGAELHPVLSFQNISNQNCSSTPTTTSTTSGTTTASTPTTTTTTASTTETTSTVSTVSTGTTP
jgi:hypothetical protein